MSAVQTDLQLDRVPMPPAIAILERAMREEIQAVRDVGVIWETSQARWRHCSVSSAIPGTQHDAIPKLVRSVMAEVVRVCEGALSEAGAPLRCSVEDWIQVNFRDKEESLRDGRYSGAEDWESRVVGVWEAFDPASLWAHIASQYAPDRVLSEARERAAGDLIRAFDLNQGNPVKRVGGRIELSIRRYSEKEYSGTRRRYGHYADSAIAKLHEAFYVFQVAAGLDPGKYELARLARTLADTTQYGFTFASRERAEFGGALTIIYFNNEVKVLLPDAVGSALNVFLSTHGAELMARYR